MSINYKKRYLKILEILNTEMKINYECYKVFLEDKMSDKISDLETKNLWICNNLESIYEYMNRYNALYDLKCRIKDEIKRL